MHGGAVALRHHSEGEAKLSYKIAGLLVSRGELEKVMLLTFLHWRPELVHRGAGWHLCRRDRGLERC